MVAKLDNMVTAWMWPAYGEAEIVEGIEETEINAKEGTIPRTIFEDIFVFD